MFQTTHRVAWNYNFFRSFDFQKLCLKLNQQLQPSIEFHFYASIRWNALKTTSGEVILIGKDFLQSDYPRLLFNVRSDWAEPFQIYEFPVVWPALVFTLYWNRDYITGVNTRSIVTKQNLWLKLTLKSTDMNRNRSLFKRLATFAIYLPRMNCFRSVWLPCTCLGLLLTLS
jgi:hypothetical protein